MDAKLIDSQDNSVHMSTGFPNFGGVKAVASLCHFHPTYTQTAPSCLCGSRHVGKSERVSDIL